VETAGELRFLRLREVLARVALSRTRVYELIAEGRFPRQVRLSDRASAWDAREIDEWMRAKLDGKRAA
jgi:prophage regulatory protein